MPTGSDPAAWVEAEGELSICRNGVHALRHEALSRWLADELWHVELDGVELEQEGVVVARRARLFEPAREWNAEAKRDFAHWCLTRARELAAAHAGPKTTHMAGDVEQMTHSHEPDVALVSFCTAKIAAEAVPDGAPGERLRQSTWLAERLELS
jgi:hypothetical protein